MIKKLYILIPLFAFLLQINLYCQLPKSIDEMTKEDVLELTYDELLELPFEDVLKLADIVGVSLDELYEMLLNKDVVSASKKVESSFEAPLSTSVISYDEIKSSGARSVEEALRLVPGLIIREKNNGNFDVHIRGNDNLPPNHMMVYSENSMTLVMIDGRPVYNYVNGGTFWETIPVGLEDIERIEVVRGPSSALYGPNAVTGVVNIITKQIEGTRLNIDADVSYGSQSTIQSGLAVGKKLNKKLAYRISGNYELFGRNTENLYVFLANSGNGGFISKEELSVLRNPTDSQYYVFDPADNVDDMYPNPLLARTRLGINGFLFYEHSEDVQINFKIGSQVSEVLSSTFGDNPSSYAGRESNTNYFDLNAKVKGLNLQINQVSGVQDIVKQDTGFKVNLQNFNANAEYDIHVKGLNIRPGFFIQQATYDDTPYLRYTGQGFLNGEKSIRSIAGSLRLDYTLLERIRLIGALRAETYETIDDLYLSHQIVASYNLNDMHNFRLVHSQANRGPFLVDTYADYSWDREGRPAPSFIKFEGTQNQDLCSMTMREFGYRVKPLKNIQADFEFFHTKTKNFGALYADSVNLNGGEIFVRMTFDNIELESEQYGISANVSYVVNEKLVLNAYGTVQRTKLYNKIVTKHDLTTQDMIVDANINLATIGTPYSTNFLPETTDEQHIASPTFYGGFIINYTPIEKMNLNLNSYFYSKQTFENKYGNVDIDPKVILNVKVSYEVVNNLKAYANLRNALMKQAEFGYMEEIGSLLTFGLTYNLN